MEQRHLGDQGLVVSRLGLGCMDMSQFYGATDDLESTATIRRAVELGVTCFDTADMYGPYVNEILLGSVLKPYRQDVVIATKFGNVKDETGRVIGVNGHPDYVRRACEGSLRRLEVETIDLYYQHRVDRSVAIEETWGALHELVLAGKVRYLGISEASEETIKRAHAVHPVTAVQTEYSLLTRDPEHALLPTLRGLGIGFVAYAPLCRGLLSDAVRSPDDLSSDDFRLTLPRFQGDNLRQNLAVAQRLREFAEARGASLAQLAIAWVVAQGEDILAIPGTKNRSRLEENCAALRVELTTEDLAALDAIAPPGVATGDRYPDMRSVNV